MTASADVCMTIHARRHERYFLEIDGELVRTTTQPLLARRFATALAARQFATRHEPHFDEWRVVRR